MDSKISVCQVFNNNPQGSRLRGRPKNRWWKCVQRDNSKFNITNGKKRKKKKTRANWEKSIKEEKVHIGLQCHLRRRRRRRTENKYYTIIMIILNTNHYKKNVMS
jgi:hypothetical protein